MGWYIAPCLEQLRTELNTRWPGRDRTSDGGVGDPAHAARVSDHNPAPSYDSSPGVVRARDFDEDGIPTDLLLREAITDPRTNYVIYERRIYQRAYGFAPRPYTGVNPHDKHMHVSIRHGQQWENDRSPWITDAVTVSHTTPVRGVDIPTITPSLTKPAAINPQELTVADITRILDALNEIDRKASLALGVEVRARDTRERTPREQVLDERAAVPEIGGDTTIRAAIIEGSVNARQGRAYLGHLEGNLAGQIATLTPGQIAAAIPANLAGQVADELARRLKGS